MIQPVPSTDAETVPVTRAPAGKVGRLLRRPFVDLFAATGLLTRLPVPATEWSGPGVRAFPIVGALLGLATLLPLVALGTAIPVAAAILALATLAILSGGLHLDGLADTFDALVAVGPDAAERARRDPAVGAAGATTLVFVLALDVVTVTDLLVNRGAVFAGLACVVAGAVSRLIPAVLARIVPSAAPDDGLGAWFVRRTSTGDVAIAVAGGILVAIAATIASGRAELAIGGVVSGVGSIGAGLLLVRMRRQLDGDLLGASVEVAFALTLFSIAVLTAWPQA